MGAGATAGSTTGATGCDLDFVDFGTGGTAVFVTEALDVLAEAVGATVAVRAGSTPIEGRTTLRGVVVASGARADGAVTDDVERNGCAVPVAGFAV